MFGYFREQAPQPAASVMFAARLPQCRGHEQECSLSEARISEACNEWDLGTIGQSIVAVSGLREAKALLKVPNEDENNAQAGQLVN